MAHWSKIYHIERNTVLSNLHECSEASYLCCVFMGGKLSQGSLSLGCGWCFAFRCCDNRCWSTLHWKGNQDYIKCTAWQQYWVAVMLSVFVWQWLYWLWCLYMTSKAELSPHNTEDVVNQLESSCQVLANWELHASISGDDASGKVNLKQE